jgi:glycosyltransferase 2 family protein
MRAPTRSRALLVAASLLLSAFFTYLAVKDVNWEVFWEGLRTSDYVWLVPALGVLAVSVWVRAVRWQLLFQPATRPRIGPTTRATIFGQFFNSILPARAGEAARIVMLKQEAGTSRAEALGTAVAERIIDVLALLLLLLLALPFLPEITWLKTVGAFGLGLIAIVATTTLVLRRFGHRPIRYLLRPLARLPAVRQAHTDRAASNIVAGLHVLERPHRAGPAFLLTFVSWLLISLSFWFTLLAFEPDLGYDAGILVLVTTTLSLVIPSLPAGVGVFEAAVLAALRPYGVEDSRALSYAVVLHALTFVPFVVAGYVVLHGHTRRLRRAAEANPTGRGLQSSAEP